MSEPVDRPPWVWDAPWVVSPQCWPVHASLRAELVLFWHWHGWLTREATDSVAGLQWHAELRRAAGAWRELSTCDHGPPGAHHARVLAAQRRHRDEFVAEATKRHRTG